MAKSAETPATAELLYSQRGTFAAGQIVGAHTHPYWQIEIFESGRTRMRAGEHAREVAGGWVVLLPPRTQHVSQYLEDGTRITSLKFEMSYRGDQRVVWRGPSSTGQHIILALIGLLPPTLQKSAPNLHIVNALLSALVAYVVTPDEPAVDELRHRPAAERVRSTVLSNDRWPLTLGEIAARVGLSPGRISHLFRAEYGTTLKSLVDQTRADIAARHLRYSTMSIKEIADATGFDSLHAFSRFFKRVMGRAPREYRRSV
ncbi:MAG: helix-turn-helix domain-containing protein [Chitinivibrionales bacterium]|nr:helix-turn-helix domain-containing protein [Chitinivibrionales bacterium]